MKTVRLHLDSALVIRAWPRGLLPWSASASSVAGFTNGQLVERVSALLNARYTARHATYDLRRLKRKGLIRRVPKGGGQLTLLGRGVAVLFTKTHGRVLTPGLALVDPALPDGIGRRSPLAIAWHALERALEDFASEEPECSLS